MTTLSTPSVQPTTDTFVIDADHSEVGFSVRHLISRTRGRFGGFSGRIDLDRTTPEQSRIVFEVDPASIDTRQPDRDTHLRSADFFDSERFPVIRFTSREITRLGHDHFQVAGTLELRGLQRPVTLAVRYHGVARDPC